MLSKSAFLLLGIVLRLAVATKQRSTVSLRGGARKKPVAVTDPRGFRTLDEWINLGEESLRLSSQGALLPEEGGVAGMARRLHIFYQDMASTSLSVVATSTSSPPAFNTRGSSQIPVTTTPVQIATPHITSSTLEMNWLPTGTVPAFSLASLFRNTLTHSSSSASSGENSAWGRISALTQPGRMASVGAPPLASRGSTALGTHTITHIGNSATTSRGPSLHHNVAFDRTTSHVGSSSSLSFPLGSNPVTATSSHTGTNTGGHVPTNVMLPPTIPSLDFNPNSVNPISNTGTISGGVANIDYPRLAREIVAATNILTAQRQQAAAVPSSSAPATPDLHLRSAPALPPAPAAPTPVLGMSIPSLSMQFLQDQQVVHNAEFQTPLPPFPTRIINQIQRGEFLSFDSLYSIIIHGHTAKPAYSLVVGEEDTILGAAARTMLSVTESQVQETKCKVTSFRAWLSTWNEYYATYVAAWPLLALELLQYQRSITRFAGSHTLAAVLAYDKAFRQNVATYRNHQVRFRWDRVSEDIFSRHLRGHEVSFSPQAEVRQASARPRLQVQVQRPRDRGCFTCGSTDHLKATCPQLSAPSSSSFTTPPFRAPQSQPTVFCLRYNSGTPCGDDCKREHRCMLCLGSHPRKACNNRKPRGFK